MATFIKTLIHFIEKRNQKEGGGARQKKKEDASTRQSPAKVEARIALT